MKRIVFALALFLGISILANFILYHKLQEIYRIFNNLRLSPLNLDAYPIETKKAQLVLYGDSHAQNWDPPPINDCINYGIGGQTSQQLLLRADYHLRGIQSKYAILSAGANDLKCIMVNPERKSEVIEQAFQNILSLTQKISAEHIVIITIPPVFYTPLRFYFLHHEVASQAQNELNQKIQSLQNGKIIVFDAYKMFLEQEDPLSFTTDGIHLNDNGYLLLNGQLANLLKN